VRAEQPQVVGDEVLGISSAHGASRHSSSQRSSFMPSL
jgi:hypothetical protein